MKTLQIFSSLLLIAMVCSCKPATEATPAKVEKKDIAIQLYSVRDDIKEDFSGFDSSIKALGGMGYTAIEAANYDNGKFYGKTPEEFKTAIEAAGLRVLSSHASRDLGTTKPEEIKWDEIWAWWDQCIDAHKAAGMQYIVTPWMPKPETLAGLKIYCDYYNKIGEKCKAKGLKFGYHNHDFEFQEIEKQVMYDYMIENTDPNLVCFEMDVYWVVRGGKSPVDYFNKYPKRFELLHIKDNKELGQSGMVGFDAIFKNTDASGVKHLVVEVEKYNYAPIESVQKSLDYLLNDPLVKKSYDIAQ